MLWLSELLIQGYDLDSFAALTEAVKARARDGEMFSAWMSVRPFRIHRKTGRTAWKRRFPRHRKASPPGVNDNVLD